MVTSPGKVRILLKEYEKAQDSAEHHIRMTWVYSSILLTGMLALLGFIIKDITSQNKWIILFVLSLLGLFICFFLILSTRILWEITRKKYERCREIEELLEMEQHLRIHEKYPRGIITNSYYILISVLAVIWLLILIWTIGGIILDYANLQTNTSNIISTVTYIIYT